MTADVMPKNLFEALARFQADLPAIRKGQTADTGTYKYDYADLADVSSAVLPRLGAVGLAFFSRPTVRDDGKFGLAYSLVHGPSGEREDGWYDLPTNLSPQKIGGLITYARRYCLCAVTGVAPAGDDDDAAGAEASHQQQAPGPASADLDEDGWPRGTTARHNGDVAAEPSRRWADIALEQAAGFKTEAEGQKLWRESAAAVIDGRCTPGEATHIQNLITARVADRRKEAAGRLLRLLAEDDPWRAKIEELADDEEARAALEELRQLVGNGQVDETRSGRIGRAVIARFPKAAVKAGDSDA